MIFPEIDLTEYERKFVRIYKGPVRNTKTGEIRVLPGVLPRQYKVTLNDTASPDQNLPIAKLTDQIQISRRARVYGLYFGGNLSSWRLNIASAVGTQYTNKTRRTQQDPVVSSMNAGSLGNALSMGGLTTVDLTTGVFSDGIGPSSQAIPFSTPEMQPFPLVIEPNWVLNPNETLIFTGTPLPIPMTISGGEGTIEYTPPLILNITVFVWEFEGWTAGTMDPDNKPKSKR